MRPIYLILALVVAGGLTFYINDLLSNQEPQQVVQQVVQQQVNPIIKSQTRSKILVAAKVLPVGHLIQVDDLAFYPWPDDAIQESFLKEQDNVKPTDLAGSVVRIEMVANEPIQRSKMVAPGERGFLAAVIKPGMKAVAIPVSNRTAVANLVMPGDRVDVLLTQMLQKKPAQQDGTAAQQEATSEQITETIIYNARILAVGQSMSSVQPGGNGRQGVSIGAYDTVTLELTPKLAEIVTLANELGRLSVALNPLATGAESAEASKAAEERLQQWPYGIQAVIGAGDTSTYSYTVQNEASPARNRAGSHVGSAISIYRGGTGAASSSIGAPASVPNSPTLR